jgi:hypothetical protein
MPLEYRFTGVSMKRPDLGELDDLVELARDLAARHAEDRAAQEDVLAPRQLGVEAGADLEQAADPPFEPGVPGGRIGDAAQDLQQRALAGAVVADDADHLPLRTSKLTSSSAQRSRAPRRARVVRPVAGPARSRCQAAPTASRKSPWPCGPAPSR